MMDPLSCGGRLRMCYKSPACCNSFVTKPTTSDNRQLPGKPLSPELDAGRRPLPGRDPACGRWRQCQPGRVAAFSGRPQSRIGLRGPPPVDTGSPGTRAGKDDIGDNPHCGPSWPPGDSRSAPRPTPRRSRRGIPTRNPGIVPPRGPWRSPLRGRVASATARLGAPPPAKVSAGSVPYWCKNRAGNQVAETGGRCTGVREATDDHATSVGVESVADPRVAR